MRYGPMVLILLGGLGLALPAAAQGRPDTRQMSCSAVQSLVDRSGEIVLSTGGATYQRFVSGTGYCDSWERLQPFLVPSNDTPRCAVNSICYDPKPSQG